MLYSHTDFRKMQLQGRELFAKHLRVFPGTRLNSERGNSWMPIQARSGQQAFPHVIRGHPWTVLLNITKHKKAKVNLLTSDRCSSPKHAVWSTGCSSSRRYTPCRTLFFATEVLCALAGRDLDPNGKCPQHHLSPAECRGGMQAVSH